VDECKPLPPCGKNSRMGCSMRALVDTYAMKNPDDCGTARKGH